ncbi:hypothetical protein E1301_Tti016210 [Triplophysa tibetana]|uniref:Uncharacterized protein n=1 Tax=Triplophysa tibetana TaxID=1572043 RepID=A0A5A9P564_9TELE|nr:hypothetical protein E1301_Tti016210 [Triplophysa tibetana]
MELYEISAERIQAYWRSHRNRRLFKLLVNTVRSAIFQSGVGGHYLSGKKLFTTSNQYSSHLDELPACLGGQENGWRFLSQEILLRNIPRENIKSETTGSVVANLKKGRSWGHLTFSHFSRQQLSQRCLPVSSRRSARVQNSAARRRRLYIVSEAERNQVLEEESHLDNINNNNTDKQKSTAAKYDIKIVLPSVETEDYDDSSSESEWEEEAEKLCNWSKQLNLDDIDVLECVD